MKIVGLTQGEQQPSTRFRWSQYVDDLILNGLEVYELQSNVGAYPPDVQYKRPLWLAKSLIENYYRTIASNKYDIRFLQRNLTATLYTFERFLNKPTVFDVDDAIFLGPRGANANLIASKSAIVVCGNSFLANHFSKFAQVVTLPTAVDTERYTPCVNKESNDRKIIGWSGSSSGFKYLYAIEPAIKKILSINPNVLLKIVADLPPVFSQLPSDRIIYEKWTPEREVEVIREFTLGIMPLYDDLWAKGKCSFKMLTYMSVGIPVVVTPVGMNQEILEQGACGLGATTLPDWVESILFLLDSESTRRSMGNIGRKLVVSNYSKKIISEKLIDIFKGFS